MTLILDFRFWILDSRPCAVDLSSIQNRESCKAKMDGRTDRFERGAAKLRHGVERPEEGTDPIRGRTQKASAAEDATLSAFQA